MMTEEQAPAGEVVIVGSDGTEHVFPAGFDPQKAAGIVRGGAQAAEPQVRSRTGQMYTPPAAGDGPLEHFGSRLVSNLNPVNIAKNVGGLLYNAVTDPKAAGQQVVEGIAEPFREVGRGEFPEAAADAATALLAAKAPGFKGPETLRGVPVSELKAAGVGEQSLSLMRNGRPSNVVSMPQIRGRMIPQQTSGNLALKTEDAVAAPQPTAAPTPTAPPTAPKMKLDAVQVARMLRDTYGAEQGGRMLYGKSVPGGPTQLPSSAERTAMVKDVAAKSTLPESARTGIDQALAGMSPEEAQAYYAKGNQPAQKYMQFAHRNLFGDERGSIPIELLHAMATGGGAGLAYHVGRLALPYAPMVARSPAFEGAVRAAVMANLAARQPAASGSQ